MIGRGVNAGVRTLEETVAYAGPPNCSARPSLAAIDNITLFSQYVCLKAQLFVIEQRLSGNATDDSDQLLAEWYASDEFSSLTETHAAIAKQLALAKLGL